MQTWDIDRFPLQKQAISEAGFPETDAEWKTWEEAQHALNQHLPGGGYDGGRSEYDPSVWMMGKHAPSHEKYHHLVEQHEPESHGGGYHMPGINAPFDDDDDENREPAEYHVVTGHVDSHDPSEWTEHNYTMFEHPDSDYDPSSAWDYFQQDNPQYNPERNINATHEVKHVHPAEHHDRWHEEMANEERDYDQISLHGLQREAPNIPGHRSYTHTDPYGGTHRLWYNTTNFIDGGQTHGSGWRTSYYDPNLPHEQQVPWTFHGDTEHAPLTAALDQVDQNRAYAHSVYSGR